MGSSAPTGTLTLVFTDIQASTHLWERLGDAFRPFLERHNHLIRDAIARYRGYEVKTQGDAFMLAFQSAADAVLCGVEIQRALEQEPWPAEVGEVLVRIGMHTGEALLDHHPDGRPDYFGTMVNRAARVSAAANGGQVLLSAATVAAMKPPPPEIELINLGQHRLRGLEGLETIYSARHPALRPRQFPSLRTLESVPTNLPERRTSFVGRERELAEIRRVLLRPETRLVTLIGFGGMGKTSTALQLAERCAYDFADGVWWIEAEEARDQEQLVQRIAFQLRMHLEPTPSVRVQLMQFLREKELLLVLDNTEQIPDVSPVVSDLISGATRLKCVVTTRRALEISHEQLVEIPPLPQADAELLFIERARLRKADFERTADNAADITELVRALECVPLAIELAASRVVAMTPREIVGRLGERFRLLQTRAPDLPPRQRALRGAIDWSYDLLTEEDRELLAELSVFRGGFTVGDAEAVVASLDAIEGITELRRHSLIRAETDSATQATRYLMLESVHDYAAEKLLERGLDISGLRRRHAEHFVRFGEARAERMRSREEAAALDELAPAYDNLHAAMAWSGAEGHPELAARLAIVLYHLMFRRGFWGEARALLEKTLPLTDGASGPLQCYRAAILHYLATIEIDTEGCEELARQHETESLQLRRQTGDTAGVAESLNHLANSAIRDGYWEGAQRILDEALELVPATDHQRRGILLHSLGRVANGRGDTGSARELYQRALQERRAAGDARGEAETLGNLGVLAHNAGDPNRARELYLESLAILRRLRDRFATGVVLFNLAELAELDGDSDHAVPLYIHAERLFRDVQSGYAAAAGEALQRVSAGLEADHYQALVAASAGEWDRFL